jgi:hypothetical protein
MWITELPLAIGLTFILVLAAVVTLGWRFYRQVPPRRSFVISRRDDVTIWNATLRSEDRALGKSVLELLCDTFDFERTDVWRLQPHDTLRAIYEAAYPPGLGFRTLSSARRFSTPYVSALV